MSPAAASSSPVVITSTPKAEATEITRPCANFRPCIWGDIFLQFDSDESPMEVNDNGMLEAYKEQVKKMFQSADTSSNVSQVLNLIDLIQRLGIFYHFEHEINEALQQIYYAFTTNNLTITDDLEACDLHSLAILFRLLRKKGYRISSDIFKKFKNNQGKFNEDKIAQDVQGLWSLYEAAQLRVHGEDILDEALDFTYAKLKSMTTQLSPSLAAQINHSLIRPLHKEFSGLQAKRYMSFYEEDPSHNKALLAFAKLNFNMQQKLHQKELGNVSTWWKKLNFVTKVPYTRDRVVESYFWAFQMSNEPKYSTSRRILGKLVALVTTLDDTYDAFGTFEELEVLTEAIKRWDISLIESLPKCIQVFFNAIEQLWDEIELVILKEGKSDILLQHIKQHFCDLAQAYMLEAKWCHEGYIPTYDEYKVNASITIGAPIMVATFIGLGEFATKEVVDWIMTHPKIVGDLSLLGRLRDDMSTHEFEQQRGHVASAVECFMNKYSISQEEAYEVINKEIENLWKDINEACLSLDSVPKPEELECIVNLVRAAELMYANFEDRSTNGELLKSYVATLLLDPVII